MEPTPAPPPPHPASSSEAPPRGVVASGSVTRAAVASPQRSRQCLARLIREALGDAPEGTRRAPGRVIGSLVVGLIDSLTGIFGDENRWLAVLVLIAMAVIFVMGLVSNPFMLTLFVFIVVICASVMILMAAWLLDFFLMMKISGAIFDRFYSEPVEWIVRIGGMAAIAIGIYLVARDLAATQWSDWGLAALRDDLGPLTDPFVEGRKTVFDPAVLPLVGHSIKAVFLNVGRVVFHICRHTLAPWSWVSFTVGAWRAL